MLATPTVARGRIPERPCDAVSLGRATHACSLGFPPRLPTAPRVER